MNSSTQITDLPELPVFEALFKKETNIPLSWERVMEETQLLREHYLRHWDAPEKRLADKNPEPFRLD